MHKVIIMGSGCAGLTAAIYAARANLAPLVIEGWETGGQLSLTTDVENFPGFPEGVQGPDLIQRMKQQAARFGGEKEFNNINLIIQYSLDLFRHQFVKKSFEIVENYSQDITATEVDTPALEQVFLNIIQNSFEALMERGSRLTITTSREGGQIVAAFEDDGPGLSENAREHLFTPFFTTKAHLRCSGLGLAAAKALVELHSGSIEADNLPAGGACVKVILSFE